MNYTPKLVDRPQVGAGHSYQIGNYYVTGQPVAQGPDGLKSLPSLRIRSVICLRDPSETNASPPFDSEESSTVAGLGIAYTNVPFMHSMGQLDFNLQATTVRRLLQLCPTPLLMHCSSGDRASALWAVHLAMDEKVPLDEAIAYGKESGLSNPQFIGYIEGYSDHGGGA